MVANFFFRQPPRRLYMWTTLEGKHRKKIDVKMIGTRCKSVIYYFINIILSVKTRPGADCRTDLELLIADFKLKLKRVNIDRLPKRYDLQNISNAYNVEISNKFCAINLVEREPEEMC